MSLKYNGFLLHSKGKDARVMGNGTDANFLETYEKLGIKIGGSRDTRPLTSLFCSR